MTVSSTAPASLSSLQALRRAAFFSPLSAGQIERVAALAQLQRYTSGSQIYTVSDPAQYFYVLAEGMVRFKLTLGNRQAPTGEIIRPGDVFGWAALVSNSQTRIATASCMTPCAVLAIDGSRLLELMEQDHSLGYAVMKQLNPLITGNIGAFFAR